MSKGFDVCDIQYVLPRMFVKEQQMFMLVLFDSSFSSLQKSQHEINILQNSIKMIIID